MHYHANSSEYIVIPPFEMFHFCYSLSQCQLGFFLSLSCRKKGLYTDIEKKSFLNLSLCLKRNIFIYIYFKFGYKIFARFFILCFFPLHCQPAFYIIYVILELLCACRKLSSLIAASKGAKDCINSIPIDKK